MAEAQANIYAGWLPVFDPDAVTIDVNGRSYSPDKLFDVMLTMITLPSGKQVFCERGKYHRAQVELIWGGDLGELMFMRAFGINRKNKRYNERLVKQAYERERKEYEKENE